MEIEDFIDSIKNKEDFTKFIGLLRDDYKNNKNDWESWTLEDYLEALEALCDSTKDIDDKPSWKDFALILWNATVYE